MEIEKFKKELKEVLRRYNVSLEGYTEYDCFPYELRFMVVEEDGNRICLLDDNNQLSYTDL